MAFDDERLEEPEPDEPVKTEIQASLESDAVEAMSTLVAEYGYTTADLMNMVYAALSSA
ncbi:hypothetical protein [Candidatus Solirubrobacter pratensis]|uniref:hypothetical protein n=1 Tax=Candidatus Solirubrobacter pratensis TaxID=1298857 RepID=UPI000410448E|nr:hypothetical protein [Candidatus Solirubrobacter pratensis]